MSLSVLNDNTYYAPLNTTIDADREYPDATLSGCGCGGQTPQLDGFSDWPLSEFDSKNLWLGFAMVAAGLVWALVLKPNPRDELELHQLRSRMGL